MKKMMSAIFWILVVVFVFTGFLLYTADRFERIENGELTLVNQNQMDR